MLYELPINETKYEEVKEFRNGKRSFVVFKLDGCYDDQLFVLAHGSDDGMICINDYMMTSEQLLKSLLKKGIKDKGITIVNTLCCYGGLQQEVTIDGVCISSAHESHKEIEVNYAATMDDKFYVLINVASI